MQTEEKSHERAKQSVLRAVLPLAKAVLALTVVTAPIVGLAAGEKDAAAVVEVGSIAEASLVLTGLAGYAVARTLGVHIFEE